MKTSQHNYQKFLSVAAACATLSLVGAVQSFAHNDRDYNGYWDGDHHYHHYEYYHNHRGYWDTRSGVRIFINI